MEGGLAIFSFITDPINEFRAMQLGHRATMALQAGNYGVAEDLNRRALAIMEHALGDIEQTAVYAHNLSRVFLAQDKPLEAVPFLQRFLEIREGVFGPNDSHVADALGNLANVYAELGKHERAETLYKRAISIYEGQLGTEHPKLAAILSCLAASLRSVGNIAEANTLAAQAEAILSRHTDLEPSDWLHPNAWGNVSN